MPEFYKNDEKIVQLANVRNKVQRKKESGLYIWPNF